MLDLQPIKPMTAGEACLAPTCLGSRRVRPANAHLSTAAGQACLTRRPTTRRVRLRPRRAGLCGLAELQFCEAGVKFATAAQFDMRPRIQELARLEQ